MLVVYPEGVWYATVTPSDVEEIIASHLVRGEPLTRLRYAPETPGSHQLEREADGRPIGRTAPWPAGSEPSE